MTETFLSAVTAVCPMILLLALGWHAGRMHYIDEDLSKKLSTVIIRFSQPFLLFNAVATMEYSDEGLRSGGETVLIALGSHVLLALYAHFAVKYERDMGLRKVTECAVIFANVGFIGLPIMQTMLGDIGRFWCGFYIVAFNLCLWSYGITIYARGRTDIHMNLRKAVLNFGTVPCLLGVVFYVLRITLPTVVASAVNMMANMCTPLILLVIGSNLSRQKVRDLFGNPKMYLLSALRLLVPPVLISLIFHLCGMPDDRVIFFGIMAGIPTAAMTALFAEQYDVHPGFASCAVSMTTVLSMITIPVSALLIGLIVKI